MKYHIIVYGCQMNVSDAERVSAVLENMNYKKTSNINEADLIMVVMCSVRQSAVDRVHGLIEKFKKIKKANPKLKTILTGCVLKRDKKVFVRGFDCVVNIKDISGIIDDRRFYKIDNYLDITPKYSSRFSANVPIMTGCNNFCSYCVVPYARGCEISRPMKDIIQEIKNITNPTSPRLRGAREIWLLGQNVNSYNGEIPNPKHQIPNPDWKSRILDSSRDKSQIQNTKTIKFPKLLQMVNDIPGNFWIRFTSSHPKDFSDELIDIMAKCKKVTPYLNLPIQSGDDKILKSMNRRYTVKDYKNKIKKLREKIPGICLSTDVIVGFPGETKKQFENTAKLFREIKYDMAYINKYSTRTSTAAAKLKDNISIAEKKRREKVLTEILKRTALEKNKKFIGKETVVLIEEKSKDYWIGKNEHYKTVKVYLASKKMQPKVGEFNKVKIIDASTWSLKGIIS